MRSAINRPLSTERRTSSCRTSHAASRWPDGTVESVPVPQTAPSLTLYGEGHGQSIYFGTRRWIGSVLQDFDGHFAALANITEQNATPERAAAAEAILTGDMATWSADNGTTLFAEANKADADALIEFLYAQSGRADVLPPDDPQVQRGRAIFETGTLTGGTIGACVDCHAMHAKGDEEPLSEDLYPILTGYGSRSWLYDFVTDPHKQYAGEFGNNAMPAFGDQLSPHDLEMLVRWLTGEYYQAAE